LLLAVPHPVTAHTVSDVEKIAIAVFLHVEGPRKFTSTPLGLGVVEVFDREGGLSLSLLILLSFTTCYYALALFFFQIQIREKSGLW
jgi:hypothetical protein